MFKNAGIIGVDFSGGREAGRKIWLAQGHDMKGVLKIETLQRAATLPNSGVERERALPALCNYLRALSKSGQWATVAGFDFSFALHRDQMPESWSALAQELAAPAYTLEDFQQRYGRSTTGRELRRATDIETRTPMAPTNMRVYRQTYYGIRDVLAPLVQTGARILPIHQPVPSTLHLIEICPASLLKVNREVGRYKGKGAERREARQRIYRSIQQQTGFFAPEKLEVRIANDTEGDALDAVLAVVAVWQTLQHPDQLRPRSGSHDGLEGRVYTGHFHE